MLEVPADTISTLDGRIAQLDAEIARRAREDETARRPMTIPGVGPITATAMAARAARRCLPAGPRLRRIGAGAVVSQAARRGAQPGKPARAHARHQAAHAGHRRAGRQEGAHRPGVDDQREDYRTPAAA